MNAFSTNSVYSEQLAGDLVDSHLSYRVGEQAGRTALLANFSPGRGRLSELASDTLAHFAVVGTIDPSYDGFVDLHTHLSGDTADTPTAILRKAQSRGLTGLAVTDHDSTRKIPRYKEIIDRTGLELDLFPGVESTALMPDGSGRYSKASPKHVLVLFEPELLLHGEIPDIPCYMPARELNQMVHELGGKTSVAHPAMGNFSVNIPEILEVQNGSDATEHFDYVEGHHGGVINLLRFRQVNPFLAKSLRRMGLLPKVVDTNVTTKEAFREDGAEAIIKGMTAGSDAHSTHHVGRVGVRYDRSRGLFTSIESGNYALVQSHHFSKPWTMKEVVRGTLGGWYMELNRRLGRNGFAFYDEQAGNKAPIDFDVNTFA